MSNVQIQISNIGDSDSEVQVKTSSGIATLIKRNDPQWFSAKAGSNITVKYDPDASQIKVDIIAGDQGTRSPIAGPKVALKVYEHQSAYIEAQTSLGLALHIVEEIPVTASRNASGKEGASTSAEGVKCGEIIIYPPA